MLVSSTQSNSRLSQPLNPSSYAIGDELPIDLHQSINNNVLLNFEKMVNTPVVIKSWRNACDVALEFLKTSPSQNTILKIDWATKKLSREAILNRKYLAVLKGIFVALKLLKNGNQKLHSDAHFNKIQKDLDLPEDAERELLVSKLISYIDSVKDNYLQTSPVANDCTNLSKNVLSSNQNRDVFVGPSVKKLNSVASLFAQSFDQVRIPSVQTASDVQQIVVDSQLLNHINILLKPKYDSILKQSILSDKVKILIKQSFAHQLTKICLSVQKNLHLFRQDKNYTEEFINGLIYYECNNLSLIFFDNHVDAIQRDNAMDHFDVLCYVMPTIIKILNFEDEVKQFCAKYRGVQVGSYPDIGHTLSTNKL